MKKINAFPRKHIDELLTILCSSFYISRYVGQELSIAEMSLDLYKIQGIYQDEMDNSLKEFDGFHIDDIEKVVFQNRQRRLEHTLDKLIERIEREMPKPLKTPIDQKDSMGNKSVYQRDESLSDINDHPVLQKWLNQYFFIGGITCFKFEKDDLVAIQKSLDEIARYAIKLDAMKQVSEEATLGGLYTFHQDFSSVPDACRYYTDQLRDECTRELLKERVKTYARIFDDGKELTDWLLINTRINAWWHHEENKYGKKTSKSF